MVKIAIAGGAGRLSSEIIDVLVATQKHEILILSRNENTTAKNIPGVTWVKTDYGDKTQLISILDGVHTVLCFITAHLDPGSVAQKLLIDAAVEAGVKRFAPSQWSGSKTEELPWYAEKDNVQAYLEEINRDKKILEYCLFQPGLLLDFLAPSGSSKHIQPLELYIDFPNRRAIVVDGKDAVVTFTTMSDTSNVVARAIEYDGEWPTIGGIKGTTLPISELLEIGAEVRGGKTFNITSLKEEDVRAGDIKSSWSPRYDDPNLAPEQADHFAKTILIGTLLSGISHSWVVSDEWNQLLPDYKFTGVQEFLEKHWAGRS